jgi:hypothetical protein
LIFANNQKKVADMKKLIALAVVSMLLLCGCSMIPQTESDNSGRGLSDKLAELEPAEHEASTPEPTAEPVEEPSPEPTPEPTPDPYSQEMLDPYSIRTFWNSTKNIDTFSEVMGLYYNSAETERLLRQVDYQMEIYTGPFENVFPGMESAECYAYVAPSGNLFVFDYKHYPAQDASPEEIADSYFAAVEAFQNIRGNAPNRTTYLIGPDEYEGFSYNTMTEVIAQDWDWYTFHSIFGYTSSADDYFDVMLLKRDGMLSMMFRFMLPLQESTVPQTSSPAQSSAEGASSSPAGDVVFGGLITHDELPPYEGILEVADFSTTPDGSGGYDCSVTIANVSYAMESSIYCMLYELGTDNAYEITLAEYDWFDKGAANTYYFNVPADMVSSGDCEVMVEYTFW